MEKNDDPFTQPLEQNVTQSLDHSDEASPVVVDRDELRVAGEHVDPPILESTPTTLAPIRNSMTPTVPNDDGTGISPRGTAPNDGPAIPPSETDAGTAVRVHS